MIHLRKYLQRRQWDRECGNVFLLVPQGLDKTKPVMKLVVVSVECYAGEGLIHFVQIVQ